MAKAISNHGTGLEPSTASVTGGQSQAMFESPGQGQTADGPPGPIGPYRFTRRLGRGGMGEVWLAWHEDLHCERAGKFPRDAFAHDRRWRFRMLREARILVSLNHPGIAALHEFREDGDRCCLILELVHGQSLAQRLAQGPIPVEEAVRIARQIAQALDYAHTRQRPVVHRDLKPGNIMLTSEGDVKVLDWGLALVEPRAVPTTDQPTPALETLDEHAILGTKGYMAPEQACGKPADKRADIFAFGCVLFECLTGRPAFPDRTRMATLTDEPDWTALSAAAPAQLVELARHCLQKNPASRLRDIGDSLAILAPAPGGAPAAAPLTPTPPPHNLPSTATSFIGRVRELAQVKQLMRSTRLLTLAGAGGCGKTRLALRAAQDLLGLRVDDAQAAPCRYSDGVWFVSLAALADPALLPQAIAAALPGGAKEIEGRGVVDTLLDRLRGRRLLLLLDNCEHLRQACADLIAMIIRDCPHVDMLATSREPLGVAGERTYRVPSMSTPQPRRAYALEPLRRFESVCLFVERAEFARHDFVMDQHNAESVADICRRLDGIPLAIELTAARVRALDVTLLAQRLDDVFRTLRGATVDPLRRHQTLEATIRWSFDLLEPRERRLLTQLAVFQGGWTLEAAEAVCRLEPGRLDAADGADVIELIESLVDKSLVLFEHVDGWPRYRLLDTVRQFALRELAEDAQGRTVLDGARRRHLDHYLRFAELAHSRLSGAEQSVWLERLANDWDNFRVAIEQARQPVENAETFARLALALHWFCYVRGQHREGRQWLEAALDRRCTTRDLLTCQLQNAAGMLAWRHGDHPGAREHYRQSLAIARELGDEPRQAALLLNDAVVAEDQGASAASGESYEQSMRIYRRLNDRAGLARAQLNAAVPRIRLDELDAAESLLRECLAEFTAAKDTLRIAAAQYNLGEVARRRGDPVTAEDLLRQSLRLWRQLCNDQAVAETLLRLALTWLPIASRAERAVTLLSCALAALRRMEVPSQPLIPAEYDALLDGARGQLGDRRFDAAWSAGQGMDLDQAGGTALEA